MSTRVAARAAALVMLVALCGVFLLGRLPGVDVSLAAAPAKDFTVTSQPISQSVQRGQSATFTLSVGPVNGFTGQVTLTAAKLPGGSSAGFSPVTVAVGPATGSSTLTVVTTASTPLGSQGFTVTGTSGSTKRTLNLTVVVSAPASPGVSVGVSPGSVAVAPGSSATYAVSVSRLNGYSGPITLTTGGTYPAGVSAALSPTSIPAGTASPVAATLTMTTSAATPSSTISVTVTGTGTSGIASTATVSLVVDDKLSAKPFSLSGDVVGSLGPGIVPRPVDLAVSNPNNQPIRITNLGVTVTGTSRSGCTASDFTVRQYAGSYPLTVPARAENVTLSTLGVPQSSLPTVAMLNRAGNQDVCKGVTVSLAYTGSATNQ